MAETRSEEPRLDYSKVCSAKLLTWGPTSPGKLAWVRSGTTGWSLWDNFARQLPSRSGFLLRATWPPSRTQASFFFFFTGSLWSDESGPAAPEEEALKAQPLHRVLDDDDFLMGVQSNAELLAAASSQSRPGRDRGCFLMGARRTDARITASTSSTTRHRQQHVRLHSIPWTPRRSRSPAPLVSRTVVLPSLPQNLDYQNLLGFLTAKVCFQIMKDILLA